MPQHMKVTVAATSQPTDTSICSSGQENREQDSFFFTVERCHSTEEALSTSTEHDGEPSHVLAASQSLLLVSHTCKAAVINRKLGV